MYHWFPVSVFDVAYLVVRYYRPTTVFAICALFRAWSNLSVQADGS